MAEPGHPPIPPHLSAKRGTDPTPPPLPATKKPQLVFGGSPLLPPKHPAAHHHHGQHHHHQGHSIPSGGSHLGAHELQQASGRTAAEGTQRGVTFKKTLVPDDYAITLEPFESAGDRNQPVDEDEDIDDDNVSSVSSSNSSFVSNAPSVQHFNISFVFKKTFREHEGARAFESMRSVLKSVYMCSLRWTYNILLFTIGILVAFIWALINGVVAFLQAWVLSPLTRVSLVVVKGLLPLILDPLSLILKACAQGCAGGGCGCAGAEGIQRLAGLQETFRQA